MFSNEPVDGNYDTSAACLYENRKIDCEQVILARNYTYKTGKSEDEVLHEMGLIPRSEAIETRRAKKPNTPRAGVKQ